MTNPTGKCFYLYFNDQELKFKSPPPNNEQIFPRISKLLGKKNKICYQPLPLLVKFSYVSVYLNDKSQKIIFLSHPSSSRMSKVSYVHQMIRNKKDCLSTPLPPTSGPIFLSIPKWSVTFSNPVLTKTVDYQIITCTNIIFCFQGKFVSKYNS